MAAELELVGRQSSHYTRVTRIFAHELGLPLRLLPIHDLLSLDPATYAGHPALKLPILRVDGEPIYGTLNICRVLARQAGREREVFWPEQADSPLLLNAHEILQHAMAAQVEVVMHEIVAQRPPDAPSRKRRQGLEASLAWLDHQLEAVMAGLPSAGVPSFFETGLYCLLEHLPFRNPIDLAAMPALRSFTQRFGERESARATPYRFDAPPPS